MVWPTRAAKRLANIALAGGLFSVAALVLAGAAFAAGIDPTGVCGAADRRGNPGRTAGVEVPGRG
jgi:hypothetical protein